MVPTPATFWIIVFPGGRRSDQQADPMRHPSYSSEGGSGRTRGDQRTYLLLRSSASIWIGDLTILSVLRMLSQALVFFTHARHVGPSRQSARPRHRTCGARSHFHPYVREQ